MTEKYKVIFYGEIIEGQNSETVKKNMSVLFKMDNDKIEKLLSKPPVLIKKDIDFPTASRYQEVLKKAGLISKIEPMRSEQKPVSASTQQDENKAKYDVIFYGELAEGQDLSTVKERLALLFKKDIAKIDKFLSQLPATIKKNVDLETASKYREAMKKAGAICLIKPAIQIRNIVPVPEKSEKVLVAAHVSSTTTQTENAQHLPEPTVTQQSPPDSSTLEEPQDESSNLSQSENKESDFSGYPQNNNPENLSTPEIPEPTKKKGLSIIWKIIIGFGIACLIFILALLAAVGFFVNEAALEFKRMEKEINYNSLQINEDALKSSDFKIDKPVNYTSYETSLEALLLERYTSEELANLTCLDLSFTKVSDLSTIKDLENLTSLNLTWTPVNDLTPLKDLKKLSKVNLSFTQVNDLTPLKDHNNLSLDFSNCQISDLNFLKDLKNLNALILNFTKVHDLDPLQEFKSLSSLDLWNTPVSDLNPLKGLENLSSLNLWKTQVNDLNPIKDLKKLSELNLRNTLVSDLGPIKDLENLFLLDLSYTQVCDLSPLSNLKKLRSLHLWASPVNDLSPLKDHKNLSKLYLWSTEVTDLSPLKNFKNLSYLDLSKNQVNDEQLSDLKEAIPGIEIKLHDSRMEEIMNRFSSNKNKGKN